MSKKNKKKELSDSSENVTVQTGAKTAVNDCKSVSESSKKTVSEEKPLQSAAGKKKPESSKDIAERDFYPAVKKSAILENEIKNAAQSLVYISETDADVEYFSAGRADSVAPEILISKIRGAADKKITEVSFEEFFANLTEIQDWFGEEEKATAQRFAELQKLLQANLRELKVFKVGKIETDIYIIGLDKDSNLTGVKTRAVET